MHTAAETEPGRCGVLDTSPGCPSPSCQWGSRPHLLRAFAQRSPQGGHLSWQSCLKLQPSGPHPALLTPAPSPFEPLIALGETASRPRGLSLSSVRPSEPHTATSLSVFSDKPLPWGLERRPDRQVDPE